MRTGSLVQLSPETTQSAECPECFAALETIGWTIAGMRNLADFYCPSCHQEFFGDLPSGHALMCPVILNKSTGKTFERIPDPHGIHWFSRWLSSAYENRYDKELRLQFEGSGNTGEIVLLNCLDRMYGHSLLKLLNAQYFLEHCNIPLVVLVPRFLRWMVPKDVSEIWTVDVSVREGGDWNTWLEDQLKNRSSRYQKIWLASALAHPNRQDFCIQRFTSVQPFSDSQWDSRPLRITFVWREDRLWLPKSWDRRVIRGIHRIMSGRADYQIVKQQQRVLSLAEDIRGLVPDVDFAVVGMGAVRKWPKEVRNMVDSSPSPATEKSWCERYSQSHVVVGVHGSNMILPSGHSGGVVELVPSDRWGNLVQDILIQRSEPVDVSYSYRYLPASVSSRECAVATVTLPKHFREMQRDQMANSRESTEA